MLRQDHGTDVLITGPAMPDMDGDPSRSMHRAMALVLMTRNGDRPDAAPAANAIMIRKPFEPGAPYRAIEASLSQSATFAAARAGSAA